MDHSILKLIHSLSHAEKRQFKLTCKKQSINNAYTFLFDLVAKSKEYDWLQIKKAFIAKFPTSSIESSANYLYKLVIDSLITNKVNNDEQYKMLYSLLQVKILQERNLPAGAYNEIKKNIHRAAKFHDEVIGYKLRREELNYLSGQNFAGISEKELVDKQLAAKNLLRDLRNVQEHNSLYELLKHRLNKSTKLLSEQTRAEMNDLVLSEIAIINSNTKQSLESKRVHLLFQSFYFIKTGDYRSALRTFYILNELYENKLMGLQHPPIDYFVMLEGILNSLRMIDHYHEMDYFLVKLRLLLKPDYPAYFKQLVSTVIRLTSLRILIFEKKYEEALNLINADNGLDKPVKGLIENNELELAFLHALVFYHLKEENKAVRQLNKILLLKNPDYASPVYRVARLFNVVMYYESRDLDYLDYEIRSYKRIFKGKIRVLNIEKFLFKIVQSDPLKKSTISKEVYWKKTFKPLQKTIEKNKYEMQLMKYFDFLDWGEKQFA